MYIDCFLSLLLTEEDFPKGFEKSMMPLTSSVCLSVWFSKKRDDEEEETAEVSRDDRIGVRYYSLSPQRLVVSVFVAVQ